jgi:hypothetical protein
VVTVRGANDLLVHGRTDVASVRVITPMAGGDLAPAKAPSISPARYSLW